MTATTAAAAGYALRKPCANCPFRTDITPYLREGRAREIASSIRQGGDFPCHKTTVPSEDNDGELVHGPKSQQCAGALIIQEREGNLGQVTRIAERLGLHDATRLDMDAPVFDSFTDWVKAHRESGVQTVTVDDGRGGVEVLEYEHCNVVGNDCEDPAGYGGGGGAWANDEEPTCNPVEDTCCRCGSTMCTACRAEDDVDGWKVCVNCAEDEDAD